MLLGLKNTKVTAAGLVHWKALKRLTFLNLSGNKVTNEGGKKLQEALPNCRVGW